MNYIFEGGTFAFYYENNVFFWDYWLKKLFSFKEIPPIEKDTLITRITRSVRMKRNLLLSGDGIFSRKYNNVFVSSKKLEVV
jgi:hypothetical protein